MRLTHGLHRFGGRADPPLPLGIDLLGGSAESAYVAESSRQIRSLPPLITGHLRPPHGDEGTESSARVVSNPERPRVSRPVASAIVGHRTEAVYRRYAIVSEAHGQHDPTTQGRFR